MVGASEQKDQGQHVENNYPPHHLDTGHQLHRLRNTDKHGANLKQNKEHHDRPGPHDPIERADFAGNTIKHFQARLAGGDGQATHEGLNERFN